MWTSSLFPEHSKCKEKGLAELEPWGPMSIHERSWEEGDGQDLVATRGGRCDRQVQARDR